MPSTICLDCDSTRTTGDGQIIHRPSLFGQTRHRVVSRAVYIAYQRGEVVEVDDEYNQKI